MEVMVLRDAFGECGGTGRAEAVAGLGRLYGAGRVNMDTGTSVTTGDSGVSEGAADSRAARARGTAGDNGTLGTAGIGRFQDSWCPFLGWGIPPACG